MRIVELPEIPRDREKLRAIIGESRYRQLRSRIIRLTSYVIIGIGVLILSLGAFSGPPAPSYTEAIYLPIITTR